jgi:hypothetical protein
MRTDCEVFIEVNVPMAYHNGVKFFISKNRVILSPGIEGAIAPNYLKMVTDKKGNVLHKQNYEVLIYLDFTANLILNYMIIDLSELKVLKSETATNISFDNFVENKIDENIFRRPFIIVISEAQKNDYEEYLKNNHHNIKYLGFFSDYITIPDNKLEDIKQLEGLIKAEHFNSSNSKRVKFDFKKVESKNDDCNEMSGGNDITTSNKSGDFKLTREVIKDPNVEKNYLLMFLNFEEEDILTSIDCMLIPNSDVKLFKIYTFKLENKLVKANLNDFLDGLKKFLEANVNNLINM